jgi:glycosyltransferase involved in cell wall biosynthesis
MGLIVNLYEPRDHWFLQQMADAIKEYAGSSVHIRSIFYKDRTAYSDGVNFFCNMGVYGVYRRMRGTAPSMRDVIMTTHIDPWPWNIKTAGLYRLPVTLIAFCKRWYDYFVARGIRPIGIATPGIDEAFFTTARPHDKKEKYTVALIGRLYRSGRKGERYLPPLLRELGHEFQWLIVGERWDSLLKSRSLRTYDIEYREHPSREDYYSLFRTFDIFLSLSRVEGGPMPLLESMAAGIVPVASDTGFAQEVITQGKSGFIYPVGDVPNLVSILRSLKHKDLSVFNQPARYAVREYTWKNFVSRIIGIFHRVDEKLGKAA